MKSDKRTITEKVCPLELAVNAISGKWKVPIIWQMNKGKKRPSELLRGIMKVDRRVLNQQLKELESDGIIAKEIFKELPPRVEYTLTERGDRLVEVLWGLNEWGKLLLPEKEK
ncbi:winged helix-turn-helix transcriptional regulator [Dysgonomonas macrotermitis]|uniref:Transcriptional regulator, HxlR family n=1 Tax=Dysgonomonas macrotermitis TaxID=1346286 RepID=A0A1M5ENM0_9BACT|nr:helix-turn-helix domain-containing protein [Dysgonomonas macrotermitis]SHF80691.1 transcriptional regulator, HxlR family [Dysgonomonas macrotermitis]